MRRRPQKNIDIHNGFGEWVKLHYKNFGVVQRFDKNEIKIYFGFEGRLYGCKKV